MKLRWVITFFILCLLLPLTSSAAIKDTIPANVKNYSKEQFLKEFGKDETSKKIINYYFNKRLRHKKEAIIFGSLGAVSFAFAAITYNRVTTGYGILFVISVALAGYTFGILMLLALYNYLFLSNKIISKKLNQYNQGKMPQRKLKRILRAKS